MDKTGLITIIIIKNLHLVDKTKLQSLDSLLTITFNP